MTPRKLHVEIWDSRKAEVTAITSRRQIGFMPPAILGLLGTMLVHLTVMPIMLIDMGIIGRQVPKPRGGTPQPDTKSEDLVLIDIPEPKEQTEHRELLSGILIPTYRLTNIATAKIAQIPPTPDMMTPLSDNAATGAHSAKNAAEIERAGMVGIYTAQIRARIERIWRRPRTPVNVGPESVSDRNESFQCLVRIIQDARGRVQETELLTCNGSFAWQQSLVIAINQASPLPAPPNPKVFAPAITLDFVAYSYDSSIPSDQYQLQE